MNKKLIYCLHFKRFVSLLPAWSTSPLFNFVSLGSVCDVESGLVCGAESTVASSVPLLGLELPLAALEVSLGTIKLLFFGEADCNCGAGATPVGSIRTTRLLLPGGGDPVFIAPDTEPLGPGEAVSWMRVGWLSWEGTDEEGGGRTRPPLPPADGARTVCAGISSSRSNISLSSPSWKHKDRKNVFFLLPLWII